MNYFTIKSPLFLVSSNYHDEEFKKMDEYLSILEKSGIAKIIKAVQTKHRKSNTGRIGYNPYNLMATVIYCFAKFKASLREIENACKFDLRVIYLMECQTPDYSVIGNFINKYIKPYQYEIFTMITKTIINEYQINISNHYVDGTKLEANANKYKFVWKPKKFHQKLDIKIKDLIKLMGFAISHERLIKSYEFNDILKKYQKREQINIDKLHVRKKRTIAEKQYLAGLKHLTKLLEYEEKNQICGENRNSYYKTDNDATAMVLKTE